MVLWSGKLHNLKVENYVLFSGLAEDSSPGGSLSDHSEEVREEPRIYRSFYNQNQVVRTSEDYC